MRGASQGRGEAKMEEHSLCVYLYRDRQNMREMKEQRKRKDNMERCCWISGNKENGSGGRNSAFLDTWSFRLRLSLYPSLCLCLCCSVRSHTLTVSFFFVCVCVCLLFFSLYLSIYLSPFVLVASCLALSLSLYLSVSRYLYPLPCSLPSPLGLHLCLCPSYLSHVPSLFVYRHPSRPSCLLIFCSTLSFLFLHPLLSTSPYNPI